MKTQTLIEKLGGTTRVAKILTEAGFKCSPQQVNNWRSRHGDIPRDYQMVLLEIGYSTSFVNPKIKRDVKLP